MPNLSPDTKRAEVESVARFARHFNRSPVELGPDAVDTGQGALGRERKAASSDVAIAGNALRFLYRITLK
jgi:hypothetical protein